MHPGRAGKPRSVQNLVKLNGAGHREQLLLQQGAILHFKSRNDDRDAKAKLAAMLMDPKAQEEFNIVKGSAPARIDSPCADGAVKAQKRTLRPRTGPCCSMSNS